MCLEDTERRLWLCERKEGRRNEIGGGSRRCGEARELPESMVRTSGFYSEREDWRYLCQRSDMLRVMFQGPFWLLRFATVKQEEQLE